MQWYGLGGLYNPSRLPAARNAQSTALYPPEPKFLRMRCRYWLILAIALLTYFDVRSVWYYIAYNGGYAVYVNGLYVLLIYARALGHVLVLFLIIKPNMEKRMLVDLIVNALILIWAVLNMCFLLLMLTTSRPDVFPFPHSWLNIVEYTLFHIAHPVAFIVKWKFYRYVKLCSILARL